KEQGGRTAEKIVKMLYVNCLVAVSLASLLAVRLHCAVIKHDSSNTLDVIIDESSHVYVNSVVANYDRQSDNTTNDVNEGDYKKYLLESEESINLADLIELPRLGGGGGGSRGIKGSKGEGFLQKVLPFMVIPFMTSSTLIPIALTMLKFMLLKSAFIGKMAIILLIINMFLRFNQGGGVYSHNINLTPLQKDVAIAHYGYNGDEEYGAYIHHDKRRF
ncbi:hypothetical protein AMK59_3958, partial [Oryctes borbonicus]